MKNYIKKLFVTGTLTAVTILAITATSKAATVKVTGDTLNIRKSPSTNSNVIAMLFKGVECELLGEEGEWYKIKYKNYTGYISKQYSEIIGEEPETNTTNTNTVNTNTTNTENNEQGSQQETSEKEETPQTTQKPEETDTIEIIYKKIKQNSNIKILPLIYSNNIGKLTKGAEVILLSQASGWSYVQTDSISGWVRTEILEDTKNTQTPANNNENNNTYTEKTEYVNESYVNVRQGAGTSYKVIKTLTLNSKVTITGEEDGWYKVKSGSDVGFILKEYLSDNQKTTTRSNTSNRTEDKVVESTKQEETTDNKNIIETEKEDTANKTTQTQKPTETTSPKEESASEEKVTTSKIKDTDVIAYAKKYLGHKYVYGGDGSDGTFDCSGFTMYVYKHFGINLPHGATSQYKSGKGTKITKQSDLKAGDIVFLTDYETGVGIGHCGIYIGDGNFIHASTTTYSVIISSLNTIYKGRFYAGLRLI